MEDTSGFYKKDEEGNWLYAKNWIKARTYTLERELRDTYTYPVDGWAWYDDAPSDYNKNT